MGPHLMKITGGGDFYEVLGNPDMLYKKPKHPGELRSVAA